jgi:hypothetical protein
MATSERWMVNPDNPTEVWCDADGDNGADLYWTAHEAPAEYEVAVLAACRRAHLMAAAPELLAACVEFVRKVECGGARSVRSYAKMKAAILKAHGEAA